MFNTIKKIYLEEIEWNNLCDVYRVKYDTTYIILNSSDKVVFMKKPATVKFPVAPVPPSAEQYIKGYRDGMSAGKENPMTAIFMGYSLEKIAELIAAHEKDNWEPKPDEALLKAQKDINEDRMNAYNDPINQAPLTKPQALTKVSHAFDYDNASDKAIFNANGFVEALEALGLIEFVKDEPEKRKPSSEKGKYIFFPNPDEGKGNVPVLQKDAVSTLRQYGYEVSKIEKPVEPIKSPSGVIAGAAGIAITTANRVVTALYQAGYKISLR